MSTTATALETHYSIAQVAEAWGISTDTVRRMFEGEPGVVVIEPLPGRYTRRRRYRTLRIPASIAERVHRRMTVVSEKGRG
jgi:Flp pilus assembly protein TadG